MFRWVEQAVINASHPARGAWIEIAAEMTAPHTVQSHPAWGAWIEMKKLLLTPYGKGRKAANELLLGYRIGAENADPIVDRDGVVNTLTPTQKAWRSGCLTARSDAAKAYKVKNNRP